MTNLRQLLSYNIKKQREKRKFSQANEVLEKYERELVEEIEEVADEVFEKKLEELKGKDWEKELKRKVHRIS